MRRWVLVFLLALLPLQSIWAEAVGYCAHEAGAKVQHFGHHEHKHEGVQDKAQGPADQDCGTCHAGCNMGLIAHAAEPVFMPVAQPREQAPARQPPGPLSLPDRPNWLALA
jgi:hypothetical protein